MTKQQLQFAAAKFGCTAEELAWALEPQVPGECGWLGGCHDPADPESLSGHCSRHEAYLNAHAGRRLILAGQRADLGDMDQEKRYFDGLGDE